MPVARPEPVSLPDVITTSAELFKNNAIGAIIEINIEESHLNAVTDKGQLLRVMNNLIQNALDALAERPQGSGRVTISLTREAGMAKIVVADNGDGIPTSVQPRIFEPYFTTKGSGTGLGLAMCRQIVTFWSGSISFISSPGEGTVFTILLPVV
jgi:signal transduction histidine kinase